MGSTGARQQPSIAPHTVERPRHTKRIMPALNVFTERMKYSAPSAKENEEECPSTQHVAFGSEDTSNALEEQCETCSFSKQHDQVYCENGGTATGNKSTHTTPFSSKKKEIGNAADALMGLQIPEPNLVRPKRPITESIRGKSYRTQKACELRDLSCRLARAVEENARIRWTLANIDNDTYSKVFAAGNATMGVSLRFLASLSNSEFEKFYGNSRNGNNELAACGKSADEASTNMMNDDALADSNLRFLSKVRDILRNSTLLDMNQGVDMSDEEDGGIP